EQAGLREAADDLLTRMTDSLSVADRAGFLLNKWTAEEEYIAGEIDHLAVLKARIALAPWFTRPFRRWAMMQRLDPLLRYTDRYRSTVAIADTTGDDRRPPERPPALWRRLLTAPRDRAKLSFLVLPDGVLVARASWLSLDFGYAAVTRIEARELVRRWYETVN